MPTNLHARLWELVAKISADILSFRNSFYYYLYGTENTAKNTDQAETKAYFLSSFFYKGLGTIPILRQQKDWVGSENSHFC